MCEKGMMRRLEVPVERLGVFVGIYPALVCGKCGEEIMDSPEVGKVEQKIRELGLWGSEPATVYKLGGNFAISVRKKVADLLKITKKSHVTVTPYVKARRIIVEIDG